jgi:two-component system chemotaxis response regulator CheB
MTIKVLVVDDSALIRKLLGAIIDSYPDLEMVGAAPDPYVAREKIRELNPDVITLDVEMPRMDGLDFLEKLMRLRPMPVLMVSSLTTEKSEITLRALELGAVDFVAKPQLGIAAGLAEYGDEIAEKLRAAARAKVRPRPPVGQLRAVEAVLPAVRAPLLSTEKVLCIGASTGGTEAIKAVLMRLPPDSPGIVIAQHMPPGFTRSFAERLDKLCAITVREAKGGERVLPGHAYIAPGHAHLLLQRSGANYVTELSDAEPVNRHRPSVDVLFRSAANCAGKNAVGVILTGMGKDGAQGLLDLRHAGAMTFGQDEASCVVYGMPREAAQIGAVENVVSLDNMAGRLVQALRAGGSVVRV